jgi:hypothetical protein
LALEDRIGGGGRSIAERPDGRPAQTVDHRSMPVAVVGG